MNNNLTRLKTELNGKISEINTLSNLTSDIKMELLKDIEMVTASIKCDIDKTKKDIIKNNVSLQNELRQLVNDATIQNEGKLSELRINKMVNDSKIDEIEDKINDIIKRLEYLELMTTTNNKKQEITVSSPINKLQIDPIPIEPIKPIEITIAKEISSKSNESKTIRSNSCLRSPLNVSQLKKVSRNKI